MTPEENRARVAKWNREHPERVTARMKSWYANNTERAKATSWRTRLREKGLTEADYATMVLVQGGLCAVCERAPREGERLCVDHDHGSGVARGLLCRPCNSAIGLLGDNVETLRRAVAYMDSADAAQVA